jgi:hypothetical protein
MFKEVLMIKDKYGNKPLQEEPGVEDAFQSIDMVSLLLVNCHTPLVLTTLFACSFVICYPTAM